MPKNKKSAKKPSRGKLLWGGTLKGILVLDPHDAQQVVDVT